MKWIDTSDLELWASKPSSKADLPLLISRLIRSTGTAIKYLSIPKGKSIYRGGWDGVVVSNVCTEFIPQGVSLWEFGTTGNSKGKADEDYDKRTKDPEGHNIADATFVFITPQVWEKAAEWVEEKLKEGKWKDIKVYDGNRLVEWMSTAPIQSYWLAKEIGKAPNDGVESAEDFWDNWKTGRNYTLLPEVITTGREKESASLSSALQGAAKVISIQASARDEAIAFTIGSFMQFELELQENILARCVIVENDNTLKMLVANNHQLVIIAKLENSNALHRAAAQGHFIILPLGPDEQFDAGTNIILPRLHRDGFSNALIKSGVNKVRAQSLSKESSRNITIFRRIEKFDYNKPLWADPANIRDIIPALLLGKWDEAKEFDKELLSTIANEPYETYISKLVKWKHTQDTPIYQIGTKWRISSPLDIWSHIARYITTADLDRFKNAFLRAIQYTKPSLELPPAHRSMASFFGKEMQYSGWLREGIIQSLIIVGVYGDEFKIEISSGAQNWVDGIIYILLKDADSNLWCSCNDIMPLIAEASPVSFMTGVEKGLEGESPVIGGIFTEINNGISPMSYHTGLLWALESLAWMPEYLSRVSLILAKLATIDPGGKLANRPDNSLSQIFLPAYPQTYATVEERLQTLQTLANRYPEIAWALLLKLLPRFGGGVIFHNHKCRWRKFNYNESIFTNAELYKLYSDIVDICLSIVGYDVDKIVEILDKSDSVSQDDNNKILNYIKDNYANIKDTDNKIWAELRKTLGHHRSSYPAAKWAWPESELAPYVELYSLFTPKSPVDRYKWLLQDHWPTLPEGGEYKDTDSRTQEVTDRRIEGLKQLKAEIGIGGIINILPELLPYVVGDIYGRMIETEDELYEIFELLKEGPAAHSDTLSAIIFRIYFSKGFTWLTNLYAKAATAGCEESILAKIIIALPQLDDVWEFMATTAPAVQVIYAQNFRPWLGQLDTKYQEEGFLKLLSVGRYNAAVKELTYHGKNVSTETIYKALEAAATNAPEPDVYLDTYNITSILEELDKRDDISIEKFTQLEMYYLPYLTSHGSPRKPKLIHKELATTPTSFVEVLKWVYKANNEEQNELEQKENNKNPSLAMAGYHLLESWVTVPGVDDDMNMDPTFLDSWINEVRNQAQIIGRIEVADAEIGKIMARCRTKDTLWPSDDVCRVIDTINTKSIVSNFRTAIFNGRGVTMRGVFDGGDQEKELAKYYRELARSRAGKWPVTASVLEGLAQSYDGIAREEDHHASEIDLDQ